MTPIVPTRPPVLTGTTVVEVGSRVAGPLAGMLLAEQGARVIKVESPTGDPWRRHASFSVFNRQKESVVLDLKTPRGHEVIAALICKADVVIENLRPGTSDVFGVGYYRARQLRPDLVYLSLPGFPSGAPRHEERTWEGVVAAHTGCYQRGAQSVAIEAQQVPLYTPLPLTSTMAAMVGVGAVAGALLARARQGVGQYIESSMYSSVHAAMGMFLVKGDRRSGLSWQRWEKLPLPAPYKCSDGRWIEVYGSTRRHLDALFGAMGRPEWAAPAHEIVEHASDSETVSEWRNRFIEVFRTKTAFEWETEITDRDGIAVVCRTMDEWFELSHAREANLLITVIDKILGSTTQPGLAVNLRSSPGRIDRGAPELGEHTDAVIAEFAERAPRDTPVGAGPRSRESKAVSKAVLDGIRVLDLSRLLAGPSCGRSLSEYGADVVKIDDPNGSQPYDTPRTELMWIDVSRGKRSLRVDLKSEQGKAIFQRLALDADVIIENFRDGRWDPAAKRFITKSKLGKLGLEYEDLIDKNPGLVYLSIRAFGRFGSFTNRGGYEQSGQAVSGIMMRHGGESNSPLPLAYPFNDYGTGLLATFGVMLALYERERTGKGQAVDVSLASTANLLQARYSIDYPGSSRTALAASGQLGESWCTRLYRARDRWIMIWSDPSTLRSALKPLPEFRRVDLDSLDDNAADATPYVESAFEQRTADEWVSTLAANGVDIAIPRTIDEVAADDTARSMKLVVEREHRGYGMIRHGGPVVHMSATPLRMGIPAPKAGADTSGVLAECGYTAAEVDQFLEAGIVK
jgi:crotonobetainyl-CoA:carnitine CoA-transferase CaiB-like acyl-CoA transferase